MSNENVNTQEELTVQHLASDIRQLAFELNNMALTVSALIEILNVNKEELSQQAKKIFNSALEDQQKQQQKEDDSAPPSIMEGGKSEHPKDAAIFSAT